MIVYGRRRVGKTFLINQSFGDEFCFKLTGIYNAPKEVLLSNFKDEFERRTKAKINDINDWKQAFKLLRNYLDILPRKMKKVVFFDEMPWMHTQKSNFLKAFETFWNDFANALDNLIFIVCGSATSWLDKNFNENKGGLYNRATAKIYLKTFTLKECEQYLLATKYYLSRYDVVTLYMVVGSIPYYLNFLDNSLSLRENIDNMFFKQNGPLADEFSHLYATLFSNNANYLKVIEALANKKRGMNREEISLKTKLPLNGTLSEILKNLTNSGFIKLIMRYDERKENIYKLVDYYSFFIINF